MLQNILKAKESRHNIKQQFARLGYSTISLNFNIPGYPKTNELLKQGFDLVCSEFSLYLKAIRITFQEEEIIKKTDEAGDICFFPFLAKNLNLYQLKEQLEIFEETHQLGRLLDVDLCDLNQNPISSNKQKKCFLCSQSALFCMRNQVHTHQKLKKYTHKKVKKYLKKHTKKTICKQLSFMATWAILTEVSLLDKPGLVSPNSNGSHTDMDYHTFLVSTSAISTYFYKIAKMGYQWNGKKTYAIISQLRVLGLQMEKDMLLRTNGVNTQKGIIFLIVFCLFISAYTLRKSKIFCIDRFRKALKKLTANLVSNELESKSNESQSHGELCFQKFGKQIAGGIRQEVEEGLPTFFNIIYPFMREISFCISDYNNKQEYQEQCIRILLKIISVNNDTNILFRSDERVLETLKTKASESLKNKITISENKDYYSLLSFCKQENISPGGSADLLAISLFLFNLMELNK